MSEFCYCTEYQSSGVPCLPGKCPNAPKSPNDRDTLDDIEVAKAEEALLSPQEQSDMLRQIQTEVSEGLSLMRRALDMTLAMYEEHKLDRVEIAELTTRVESLEQWRNRCATSKAL